MTKEEALNTLMKMRAWRTWGKEQKEEERPEMPEQKEVDAAFDVCIEILSRSSLPSNLDEAAEEYYDDMWDDLGGKAMAINYEHDIWYPSSVIETVFKAGAEWMARQGVTVKGLLYGGSLGIPDIPEEFYNDKEEEVIVQIRKK